MSSPPRPAEAQAGPVVSGGHPGAWLGRPVPAVGGGSGAGAALPGIDPTGSSFGASTKSRGACVRVFLSGSVGTSERASPEAGGYCGGRAGFIIIF